MTWFDINYNSTDRIKAVINLRNIGCQYDLSKRKINNNEKKIV